MGPLEGVRVVDLTTGPGRSAAHLLAGLGAEVLRLGRGDSGPPVGSSGNLLDLWFDAGTRRGAVDLESVGGRQRFRDLAAVADLVIDDMAPGWMADRGVGCDELRAGNPALVHVSVTPFGSQGPRSGWQSSDLVAQALGGWLSVTGNPDEPVALWGRQAWNLAGMYAAVEALAGIRQARQTGRGAWVDLSMHQAVVSCSEHVLMYWWFAEALASFGAPVAGRQRSLHWIRAFEVVPCQRGHLMISPAAGGLLDLIAWLKKRGFAEEIPAEPTPDELVGLIEPMMVALREAALAHDATELFEVGQSLHVPFGEAYNISQVAECVQHEARGFLRPVEGTPDSIRLPGPLGRFERTPAGTPSSPPSEAEDLDDLLAGWAAGADRGPAPDSAASSSAAGPLAGLRVLDFTHVLAGPFASRVMGDLGADVIRLQTIERNAGTAADSFPYNVMWARNKRSIQLEMGHAESLEVLRQLVEQADIVVDNFSAGVMARWGAGPEQLRAWNPGIVTMSMSGCGAGGPWESYVTYAPTVHALSGFTALTGPEGDDGCGPGIAYNDHVSGLVGATLLLSAIRHRDETGEGQHIDVSQFEIGTWLTGPAVVDYLATGREARSSGNRDPWVDHAVNDVFRCADGEWLAVTVDNGGLSALESVAGSVGALADWAAGVEAEKGAESLQAAGIAAGLVQNARHLIESDPQLAAVDWLVDMDSSMAGTQQTERHPARWVVDGAEVELVYRPSPFLGEHNFEVYGELLGWDEVAVAEAMGDGLIQ